MILISTSPVYSSSSSLSRPPECKSRHHHRRRHRHCRCRCVVVFVGVVPVVEFNCLLFVGVVIIRPSIQFFWGLALALSCRLEWGQTARRQTKSREAWFLVIRVEEDGIIAHGIVGSRLIVELDFEVARARQIQVYGGYFAAIDATITELWPPLVRDVQAETYQRLRPFRVDGGMWNDDGRHREQKEMRTRFRGCGVCREAICARFG